MEFFYHILKPGVHYEAYDFTRRTKACTQDLHRLHACFDDVRWDVPGLNTVHKAPQLDWSLQILRQVQNKKLSS